MESFEWKNGVNSRYSTYSIYTEHIIYGTHSIRNTFYFKVLNVFYLYGTHSNTRMESIQRTQRMPTVFYVLNVLHVLVGVVCLVPRSRRMSVKMCSMCTHTNTHTHTHTHTHGIEGQHLATHTC